MNLIELIMGCFVAFMIVMLGGWTFMDIAFFITAAILMLFFFLLLLVRKKKGEFIFLIFSVLLMIVVAIKLPVLFPLRTHIQGGTFHNESLATVLQHISTQRQEWPVWKFRVYDEKAANSPVTVIIPDDCTLQQALDAIAQATQCDYDWFWSKGCGNAPTPGYAAFCFRRSGDKITSMSDAFLYIDSHDAWQPERPK